MLVLTLKTGESFKINGEITVKVLEDFGDDIRIGVDAPKYMKITRDRFPRKTRCKKANSSI